MNTNNFPLIKKRQIRKNKSGQRYCPTIYHFEDDIPTTIKQIKDILWIYFRNQRSPIKVKWCDFSWSSFNKLSFNKKILWIHLLKILDSRSYEKHAEKKVQL